MNAAGLVSTGLCKVDELVRAVINEITVTKEKQRWKLSKAASRWLQKQSMRVTFQNKENFLQSVQLRFGIDYTVIAADLFINS